MMKKVILCFFTVAILLFSACSCNEKTKLYFNASYLDGTKQVVYDRTYNVTIGDYASDGTYSYKAEKKSTYGNITVTGGVATIKVECVNTASLPDTVDEKFRSSLGAGFIYKITNTLNLPISFEKTGEDVIDTINSESYFFGEKLIPLYTKVESITSYIGLSNNKVEINRLDSIDETIYHSSSYQIIRKAKKVGEENYSTTKKSYDYEKNTVIDNASLFLAIENYPISKDTSKSLAVVTPSYGKEKSITIKCYSKQNEATINNTTYPNVKLESFYVTPEKSGCFGGDTGKAQLIYLSQDANGDYKMIKYVSPLTSYDSTYTSLGALIYELNETI